MRLINWMNNTEKAKQIIEKIIYITLATCSKDGQSWNSPVFAFHDESSNFYWASWIKNQHSKNIRENPHVFIVIYDSTAPEGTGKGVYIKAKAYELNEQHVIEQALSYRNKKVIREAKAFMGDYPRRIYKAVPEKVWINGNGEVNGNDVDIRMEVSLLK